LKKIQIKNRKERKNIERGERERDESMQISTSLFLIFKKNIIFYV